MMSTFLRTRHDYRPVRLRRKPVVAFTAAELTLRLVPIDLASFDAVLLDLDGTVYHEHNPLPGAIELIRRLQSGGRNFACLSNSPSSPQRVCRNLDAMGIKLVADQIYTAAAAACDYVLDTYHEGASVFNLCTESIGEMLEGRVRWVQSGSDDCDVVIAGAPSNVNATPQRQRVALELLRRGAALVGLCNDRLFPGSRGIEFGAGALCAMLAYAANVKPFFCGKPERIFFIELCNRLKVEPGRCVLIGDNLESDVGGARSVGMTSVLVLSGVTSRRDLESLPQSKRPDHVIDDLSVL
jgi:HAD superfamily hydrolase (TIGR01450 family)